jgi:trans-aconitate methyltransferase
LVDNSGRNVSSDDATELRLESDIYTNGEYARRNPTFAVEDSPWKARQVLEAIARLGLRPRRVCEVGCGAGEILRQVQLGLSPDVICDGFDVNPDAIRLAAGRAGPTLKFRCGDFTQIETDHYDVLLCLDVFEHVPDYLGFLRAIRPRADVSIFHIPIDLSAQWVIRSRPIMKERESVGHLHHFTVETALDTLAHAGYEILDRRYTAGALDLPDKSWKQRIARIPRRVAYRLQPDLTVRVLGGYALLVVAR